MSTQLSRMIDMTVTFWRSAETCATSMVSERCPAMSSMLSMSPRRSLPSSRMFWADAAGPVGSGGRSVSSGNASTIFSVPESNRCASDPR